MLYREDVLPKVSAPATNLVWFTNTIATEPGDCIGYGWTSSRSIISTTFPTSTRSGNIGGSRFIAAKQETGSSAWSGSVSSSGIFQIRPLFYAPGLLAIGDSITTGFPVGGASYPMWGQGVGVYGPAGNTFIEKLADWMGISYVNMAVSSSRTDQIRDLFCNEGLAFKPNYLWFMGGINDVSQGTNAPLVIQNITNLFEAAATNRMTVIWGKILGSYVSASAQTNVDLINSNVAWMAANWFTNVIVVDARADLGKFRSGGPPGNLWDLQPTNTADGIHLNQHGQDVLVASIERQLEPYMRTSPPALSLTISAGNCLFRWPAINGAGYGLHSTTNLGAAGSWPLVTAPLQTNGGRIATTVPADAPAKFFRLEKP